MEKGNSLLGLALFSVFKLLTTHSQSSFILLFSLIASGGFICVPHHDDLCQIRVQCYRLHVCSVEETTWQKSFSMTKLNSFFRIFGHCICTKSIGLVFEPLKRGNVIYNVWHLTSTYALNRVTDPLFSVVPLCFLVILCQIIHC